MRAKKVYHATMRVSHARGKIDELVRAGLSLGDKSMTADEIDAYLEMLVMRGFECIPPCANHDKRGWCLGHTIQTEVT